MIAKNTEPKEFIIGDYRYYIHPFGAFKAANLSGDLAALFIPLLGALIPLVDNKSEGGLLDLDVNTALPEITKSLSLLSGDQVECILKKLLTKNRNIAVEEIGNEDKDGPEWLTDDIANIIFCGDVKQMYILAYYVIQTNYSGFFGKLSSQFGTHFKAAGKMGKMK